MTVSRTETGQNTAKLGFGKRLLKDLKRNYVVYLMVLPVIAYYIIFCYVPMYGVIISFMDYDPGWGMLNSEWVGFRKGMSPILCKLQNDNII